MAALHMEASTLKIHDTTTKMRMVYQIVPLLLASVLLCACSGLESTEEGFPNELPNVDEKSMDGRRPLSIQIKAEVIPAAEENIDHQYEERLSAFLVDTWWKMSIWIVALVALTLMFCYITRCCYLVWDCCTDSYWGCCPKREDCKRFMLLKCCDSDCGFGKGVKYEYEICRNKTDRDEDSAATQNVGGSGTFQRSSRQANIASSGSSELDFTLKNVEDVLGSNCTHNKAKLNVNSRWKDTSLTILSSMDEAKVSKAKSNIKSPVTRNSQYSEEQDMETAEALPHLHDGEYFNFLNVFGLGGAKCEYSMIGSSNGTGQVRKGSGKQSLGHCIKQRKGSAAQDEGNETSRISPLHESCSVVQQHNNNFLTSNSFSNGSYQRYGLNIEEGRRGKYHPLPEAQSELLPPDKFVQLQKDYPLRKYTSHDDKKALMASRRRSRSMETFTKHQNNPDELGCRSTSHETSQKLQRQPAAARSQIDVMIHHQIQRNGTEILDEPADGLSKEEEDHSHSCDTIQQVDAVQPSDADFALYSVPNKKKHDQEQCNGNNADKTLPVSDSKSVMVPIFLPANASQFASLPGKSSGGILHSATGRRLIDSDMEKHLLFGRETTL